MGNQLDRITHLSYSELPTGDPSGIEKDELRVGVAYFFSDEDEDLDEQQQTQSQQHQQQQRRGPAGGRGAGSPAREAPARLHNHHHHHHHHLPLPPQLGLSEPLFSAFRGPECIFAKARGDPPSGELSVYPASALPALCGPGDLLELFPLGGPAGPATPHWAVYVGGGQIIHLRAGQIRQDGLFEGVGRVVSSWYRFRPLVAELVVQNALGHLGLASPELCWTNSESFAAWCRFGKREFKAGGELQPPAGAPPQYYLQVRLPDGAARSLRFHRLEDLIREKRRLDAAGAKLRVIHELELARVVDDKEL